MRRKRWVTPPSSGGILNGKTSLAGFTIAISVLLAGAYQTAAPAVISTFEYSYLVFVSIWDILFFGTPPTFASVTGMVLIVVAGLLVLHRK